ncbi:histone-fold-containing protein [Podospora australis]|uniref:Histone-fold-containing protein n=1 Tax=Podospora australis TaxID=1536484 RepID=A0AAN6WTB3_9PEZI|nr:histone-fold-containing protein [Podospora australis]
MPYNTTAIPPRKEVTGQTLLPLTRVKKIVAQDQDITVCSNNAAFVITLATEMFVQYLAEQAQEKTKLERKPRRNIQYKDLANAVAHQDNLEFLEDVIPRTASYKEVKAKAAAARSRVQGDKSVSSVSANGTSGTNDIDILLPNGKRQKSIQLMNGPTTGTGTPDILSPVMNGSGSTSSKLHRSRILSSDAGDDPSTQLEMEMARQHVNGSDSQDVDMTG